MTNLDFSHLNMVFMPRHTVSRLQYEGEHASTDRSVLHAPNGDTSANDERSVRLCKKNRCTVAMVFFTPVLGFEASISRRRHAAFLERRISLCCLQFNMFMSVLSRHSTCSSMVVIEVRSHNHCRSKSAKRSMWNYIVTLVTRSW